MYPMLPLSFALTMNEAGHDRPSSLQARSHDAERLRMVIDSAWDAFVTADADGFIVDWNPRAEVIFGWSADDAIGRKLVDTIVPAVDRDAHAAKFRLAVTAQAKTVRREVQALHRDGHEFPIEMVVSTGVVNGHPVANALMRDITERRATEDALRRSESRLKEATELANVGSWEWDFATDEITWSDQAFRNSGFEPGTVEPSLELFLETVHPDDLESVKSTIFGNRPVPGHAIEFEHRTVWPDGAVKWLYARNTFGFDDDGVPIRLHGITQDITGRKLGEEARSLLATVVGSIDDAIYTIDLKSHISSWNAGAERLFGYSREEALGSRLSRLCPPDLHHELVEFHAIMLAGKRVHDLHTQRFHRDGTRLEVSVSAAPIIDESGMVTGGAAIVRDIRDAKQAENALKDAFEREQETVSQLRELDRARESFVSTVSHELRTPLTSILGFLELFEDESVTTDQREMLLVLDRNANRLLHLIEDLLDIGRIDSGSFAVRMGPVDVGAFIERARIGAEAGTIAAGQELTVDVADNVGSVRGDAVQLERVISNLLTNAVKFTPRGGHIGITAERESGGVEITVADSGMGIGPMELEHVFEPFYRAHSANHQAIEGTGLGLAIVNTIVQHHHGTISCESTEGIGTTMHVHLRERASIGAMN